MGAQLRTLRIRFHRPCQTVAQAIAYAVAQAITYDVAYTANENTLQIIRQTKDRLQVFSFTPKEKNM